MKKLFAVLLMIVSSTVLAQEGDDVQENSIKPFYSTYVNLKLSQRWSIDNYTLLAMRSPKQKFWLVQSSIGVNFRINRIYTASLGYGHALYKHTPWWDEHYPQKPNFLNTVSFHTLSLGLKRSDRLGEKLRITNRIIVQQYMPKFEKYQMRFQYNMKLGYRKNDLPIKLKPFVQGAIYYYFNGVPITYFDEDTETERDASPNGFHRFRLRVGTSFRPIPKNKRLSVVLSLGLNQEFNINGLGNNLHVDSEDGNTVYPFNSYTFAGLQLNYFLGKR